MGLREPRVKGLVGTPYSIAGVMPACAGIHHGVVHLDIRACTAHQGLCHVLERGGGAVLGLGLHGAVVERWGLHSALETRQCSEERGPICHVMV